MSTTAFQDASPAGPPGSDPATDVAHRRAPAWVWVAIVLLGLVLGLAVVSLIGFRNADPQEPVAVKDIQVLVKELGTLNGYLASTNQLMANATANATQVSAQAQSTLAGLSDSLASVDTTFRLPEHLASSFGQETVEAAEFAGRWHAVIEEQHRLLNTLESITSPRELMTFLHRQDEEQWKHRLTEYIATHDRVLEIDRQAETMKAEIARLRALEDELKARVSALELEKGSHYREHIKPLRQRLWELSQEGVGEGEEVDRLKAGVASHEERRAGYDRQVAECREAIRKVHQDWEETRKAYQALDKSPETIQAEKHLAALESEAEIARARLIRDAVLTSRGLVHTNHRPTAWWFLMVDPSRGWFRRVAETTELYLEPVTRHSTEGC